MLLHTSLGKELVLLFSQTVNAFHLLFNLILCTVLYGISDVEHKMNIEIMKQSFDIYIIDKLKKKG